MELQETLTIVVHQAPSSPKAPCWVRALGISIHHWMNTNGRPPVVLLALLAASVRANSAVSASTQAMPNSCRRLVVIWLASGLRTKSVESKETLEHLSTALLTGICTLASVVPDLAISRVQIQAAVVVPTGGKKVSKCQANLTQQLVLTRTHSGSRTCNQASSG